MSEHTVSRGEYDINVESTQSRVNASLELLQNDIDVTNLMVAELIKDEKLEEAQHCLNEAVQYLNENWEFANHIFIVSGHVHGSEFALASNGVDASNVGVRVVKKEYYASATSLGFSAIRVPNDEDKNDVKVVMLFGKPTQQFNSVGGAVYIQPRLFVDPTEASLTYLRPNNDEVVSSDLEDCVSTIDYITDSFHSQVNDDQSEFYSMDLEAQQEFIKQHIDAIDASLPHPETADNLAMTDAEAPLFFVVGETPEDSGGLLSIKPGDSSQTPRINGAVLGFCVPDEIANRGTVRYTKRSDLMSSSSGLCAIVQPFENSNLFLPEDLQSSDLIVPLNNLESVSYSLI